MDSKIINPRGHDAPWTPADSALTGWRKVQRFIGAAFETAIMAGREIEAVWG